MKFIDLKKLEVSYENYPFPHTVIDNLLNEDILQDILSDIHSLNNKDANQSFLKDNGCEYNKLGFNKNYPPLLNKLFVELNSEQFIKAIEKLTNIPNLICNDLSLKGAGIHRILNNGYLQFHTDFNTYYKNNVKRDKKIHLDRRINLLLYMNPEWKDEYNGHLMLCDKDKKQCVKKILPILNRCVIFNTTNRSIHGHPNPLNVPPGIERNSIAIYYYTKNDRDGVDFEGDKPHSTIWYKNIKDL